MAIRLSLLTATAITFCASAVLWSQQTRPALPATVDLFAEARAAAGRIDDPDWSAELLLRLATYEAQIPGMSSQALSDAISASHMSSSIGSELASMQMALCLRSAEDALALARQASVSGSDRVDLFDDALTCAGHLPSDAIAIVREAEAAGVKFPFAGAFAVIRDPSLDAGQRLSLADESRAGAAEIDDKTQSARLLLSLASAEAEGGMPSPAVSDAVSASRISPAISVELVRVQTDICAASPADALALARQAAVPGNDREHLLEEALICPEHPPANAIAVVHEAQSAGGRFPLVGASAAVRDTDLDSELRRALVQEGYAAIDSVKNPGATIDLSELATGSHSDLLSSLEFVSAGHEVFPDLDPQLAAVLPSAIAGLTVSDLGIARQWLALLAIIDPVRAASLGQQYPQLASQSGAAANANGIYLPYQPQTPPQNQTQKTSNLDSAQPTQRRLPPNVQMEIADVLLEMPDAASATKLPDGLPPLFRFDHLAGLAEMVAEIDPSQAAPVAARAYALIGTTPELDPAILTGDRDDIRTFTTMARLVAVMYRSGQRDQAAALAKRCLDAADRLALYAQLDYINASSEAPTQTGRRMLLSAGADVAAIYSVVAHADRDFALTRARNMSANYIASLVLSAIAAAIEH